MAPGINGGGRPTGTVPKVKSHQEALREYGGTPRRDYNHFSHMSNNLVNSIYRATYYIYVYKICSYMQNVFCSSRIMHSSVMIIHHIVMKSLLIVALISLFYVRPRSQNVPRQIE